MLYRKFLFTLVFFGVALAASNAQTYLTSTEDKQVIATDNEDLPVLEGENWTFYHDKNHKVYYIDFETINVNLNELIIKNSKGDVVYHDELWNLPVNTIYELDFSKFRPGRYEVELRTFTGCIKKDLLIETE